jgi:membrane associated rhomboid family serine protease
MFGSLFQDLKRNFAIGNMVTKLIYIQVFIFILFALIKAFTPTGSLFYSNIVSFLGIPASLSAFIFKPWTLFTYFFINLGFWDTIFSVLVLYIFGRIVGDLLGDRRVLPLYIMGGIFGGLLFLLFTQFFPSVSVLTGSAASAMCLALVAAMVAPDYNIRLLLLGDVKIKYIVGVFILLIFLGMANKYHAEAYIARLGGVMFGMFYIYKLRNGVDLADYFNKFGAIFNQHHTEKKVRKNPKMKVAFKNNEPLKNVKSQRDISNQENIDAILDKINKSGYDSLNDEEKEFLFLASKK